MPRKKSSPAPDQRTPDSQKLGQPATILRGDRDQKLSPRGTPYVGIGSVTDEHLNQLDAQHWPRWNRTRLRADEARRLLAGEMKAPLPSTFETVIKGGGESCRADLADKYTQTQSALNLMISKVPEIKRHTVGHGERAQTVSTRIEQFDNEALNQLFPDEEVCDHLLIESACALVVAPSPAHWEIVPDFFETLDGDAYDALDDDARASYRAEQKDDDEVAEQEAGDSDSTRAARRFAKQNRRRRYTKLDARGNPIPAEDFQRDRDGRDAHDPHYQEPDERGKPRRFRYDMRQSATHFDAVKEDLIASNPPLSMRAIPIGECAPIFGPGMKLEGMLIRSKYFKSELIRRDFLWTKAGEMLSPAPDDGQVELIEWWALNHKGRPYVAYHVRGMDHTWRMGSDGLQPAVIDLYAECGLTRLPVAFEWGLSWKTRSLDMRSMPFTLPYMKTWLNIDAMLTGITVHTWWRGFPTLIEEPSEHGEVDVEGDDDDDDALTLQPMMVHRAKGRVTEIGTQGVARDAYQVMAFMLSSNERNSPSPGAMGGEAASGIDRTLSRAYLEDAQTVVLEARKRLRIFAAEIVNEFCTWFGKKYRPVSIYADTTTPAYQDKADASPTKAILTLDPWLCGGNFKVDAVYKTEPGENPVKSQLFAEWQQKGLILDEEWREWGIGDPNPEVFLARKLAQQFRESPLGQARLMQLAARLAGDKQMADLLDLQALGDMAQGGVGEALPMAAQQGLAGPGQMTGVNPIGNPASSAIAGAVGGALQHQSLNAAAAAGAESDLAAA